MPHTPAPWKVTREIGIGVNRAICVDVEGMKPICQVSFDGGREEDAANARLIAAAPELLAALIDMTPYAYGCTKKHTFTTHSDCPDCQKAERARAAIKQAIGKQPEPDYEEPADPDPNAPNQSERDEAHGNQYRDHERTR